MRVRKYWTSSFDMLNWVMMRHKILDRTAFMA